MLIKEKTSNGITNEYEKRRITKITLKNQVVDFKCQK